MNEKVIKRMSEEGAVNTIHDICEGMKEFVDNNTGSAKDLLLELFNGVLEPLGNEDFFGTEGWEHYFGIEE